MHLCGRLSEGVPLSPRPPTQASHPLPRHRYTSLYSLPPWASPPGTPRPSAPSTGLALGCHPDPPPADRLSSSTVAATAQNEWPSFDKGVPGGPEGLGEFLRVTQMPADELEPVLGTWSLCWGALFPWGQVGDLVATCLGVSCPFLERKVGTWPTHLPGR